MAQSTFPGTTFPDTAFPDAVPVDAAERWRVPEAVAAPDVSRVTIVGARVSDALGMRPAGWAVAGVVVLVVVLGWTLRWQELRLVAVFAGLVLGVALLFTIGHPSFQVDLHVPDRRVVVGEVASGGLRLVNTANRRNLPARIDLPIGDRVASFDVPSLAPGGSSVDEFTIPTDRRCVLTIGPAQSIQGDPFSLTGRQTEWTTTVEVFVHPRTVPLAGRQTGFVHDLEGHSSTRTAASDMSFQSLREYAPGDDRRQVHWRSSAHIGKLMVRQFEETLQSRVALGIDLAAVSYLGADDFEPAVSVVASLALQAVREQNPLTLFHNAEAMPAVSGPRALDELSRLERRSRTDLQTLASTMMRLDPQASVVMLVTGAGNTLDTLRRACAVFDLDTRVVGIQVDPAARIMVRNVANVSLVRIAELSELPRAMRRAMP
ncbi:DUF58 domain-containing protein [Brooklawnia cerclae]|uniref:Uncharacterized protein (DUF58 family) n=1 Tax=Brooklawnia cerclae TaxID=349934 RepID=A0ABX0SIU8_9ACTN|nr:DUF58 domain-containing protein [Brooklawnia cerclae]NIH58325.1 uncharacterized protein (DUF58 family) [Brooklawnia cerclae]